MEHVKLAHARGQDRAVDRADHPGNGACARRGNIQEKTYAKITCSAESTCQRKNIYRAPPPRSTYIKRARFNKPAASQGIAHYDITRGQVYNVARTNAVHTTTLPGETQPGRNISNIIPNTIRAALAAMTASPISARAQAPPGRPCARPRMQARSPASTVR